MKGVNDNKGFVVMLIIFIAAIGIYELFFKASQPIPDANAPSQESVGASLVTSYNSLQSVTLDQGLFTSPAYTNLVDFSTVLVPQPVGKTDPFASL